ncbi:MAG: hypothetical protein QXE81_02830 [Desulfurococcaceae archaeon]
MPVRYRCGICGHILYEFKGVGQNYIGVLTPEEVIKLVGYICPSCKKVLETPRKHFRDYIYIKPVISPLPESLTAPQRTSSRLVET